MILGVLKQKLLFYTLCTGNNFLRKFLAKRYETNKRSGKESKTLLYYLGNQVIADHSILANIVFITLHLLSDDLVTKKDIIEELSQRIELLFWSFVTLALTFLPDYIEHKNIHLPHLLENLYCLIFIFAGIFLSVRFELYYNVFWWDDLLHAVSGVIIGFLGFIIIYKINGKYSMDVSPLLVAVLPLLLQLPWAFSGKYLNSPSIGFSGQPCSPGIYPMTPLSSAGRFRAAACATPCPILSLTVSALCQHP